MISLNETDFKEKINDGIVLIDFFADWCSPCKMVSPILEEISKEREDIKIYKVNVDENQKITMDYGVQSIPTLILFINGQKQDTVIGALPKTAINKFLDKNIKEAKSD